MLLALVDFRTVMREEGRGRGATRDGNSGNTTEAAPRPLSHLGCRIRGESFIAPFALSCYKNC